MTTEQEDSQYEMMPEDPDNANALNLKWVVGLDYKIHNGVHNLSNDNRNVLFSLSAHSSSQQIFYTSAHTGVIFDWRNRTQKLLQGHCNQITCTAYNAEQDIIVTADKGPDCMLVIWDAKEGSPRKTIFDPHPQGTQSLDISPDGQYILTMSRLEENQRSTQQQTICLWEWAINTDQPEEGGTNPCLLISCQMDPRFEDYHFYIKFNPDNPNEFVTTGPKRVGFWTWEEQASWFEFYSPGVSCGSKEFTQTVFIPNNTQAVSGTHDGYIVVWDISLIMDDFSQPEERRNIKTVNLMNRYKSQKKTEGQSKKDDSPGITILLIQDKYLVVGSSNGSIRFYDDQYRIISWFENIDISDITSISFAQTSPPLHIQQQQKEIEEDNEDGKKDDIFWCPDFIVVDHKAEVRLLAAELFDKIDDEEKKGTKLLKSIVNDISFIAVRPESTELAFCCNDRKLFRWDYRERNPIIEPFYQFSKEECDYGLNCIRYSPDGKFLIVGIKDSFIYICKYVYDEVNKCEKTEWEQRDSKLKQFIVSTNPDHQLSIVDITFSSDSRFFACYDEAHSITLFKYGIENPLLDEKQERWYFLAKRQGHTLPITSISFGEYLTEKGEIRHRLFSIGKDMHLVEYDIYNSTKETMLKVAKNTIKRIEQEYAPTASIWYPVNIHKKREEILLTANEEFHLKLWDVHDNQDIICKRTCLGPTYGGPITKLLVINPENIDSEFEDKFLAYQTENKIVGIIKLPIDGNPDKTMGLIAHPGSIASIACSGDGKFLFTCGGKDKTINQWSIFKGAITDNYVKYEEGDDNDPFMNLLEGGTKGQAYKDMQFFFYYAQIRSQDENTTESRKLTGKVPLEQIPSLMRAMGHYPTEQEIQNMGDEIKHSKIQENKTVDTLDQNDFVKLFLNHRPVYGIGEGQIREAFEELTKRANSLTDAQYINELREKLEQSTDKNKEKAVAQLYSPGTTIDKEQFIKFLHEGGEKMPLDGNDGINTYLNILLGNKNGKNALDAMPKKLSLDYIMKDLFGFEQMHS